jgi:hypothetical protein
VDWFVVDVVVVVAAVDVVGSEGVDELVVVVGESTVAGGIVVGVSWLGPVVVGVVVVEVVGAAPVSAETQLDGGVEAPPWPGITTVPAHPKFEKCASSVTVPPSEKDTVDADSRMNPDASMETRSWMVRYPSEVNVSIAALIVLCSSELVPGAEASELGSIVSSYRVTATPSTVELPTGVAPVTAGCSRSRYPVGLAIPIMATAPSRCPSVPSTRPANPERGLPPALLDWGFNPLSLYDTSQTVVGSTRTPTWSPLMPFELIAADAAMAIGFVSIVPDPCTSVLWRTGAGGHDEALQLGPSIVLLLYGVSLS